MAELVIPLFIKGNGNPYSQLALINAVREAELLEAEQEYAARHKTSVPEVTLPEELEIVYTTTGSTPAVTATAGWFKPLEINPTVAAPQSTDQSGAFNPDNMDFSVFKGHSDILGDNYTLTNLSRHACTTVPTWWWNLYFVNSDEGKALDLKNISFWNTLNDEDSDMLHDDDWEVIYNSTGDKAGAFNDAKLGDIAISFAYGEGGKKTKHAQMWTGKDWRSDFIQKNPWVYGALSGRNGDKSFIVLRNKKLHPTAEVSAHKNGGDIHIKKLNEGKFTEYCGGKVTAECIEKGKHSTSAAVRKRANFAANARKWKH